MKPEMSRRPISTASRMRCITFEGELEVYCMGRPDGAGGRSDLPPGTRRTRSTTCRPPSVPRPVATGRSNGLDGYFEAMSSPATSMELPERPHALSDPAPAIELAARYRVKMLTQRKQRNCCPPRLGGTAKEPGHQEEIADRKTSPLSIALGLEPPAFG